MSGTIPVQLQRSPNLFSLNEKLRSLRSNLDLLNSKAQSGSYSLKTLYKDTLQEFDTVLAEMVNAIEIAVIPPDSIVDFQAGLVTMDDFGDFDTLQYYTGIRQFQFSLYGLKSVMYNLSDATALPTLSTTNPESGVADAISDEEFLQQGFSAPTSELVAEYVYYMIKQGDTLQGIAQSVLQDSTRAADIARISGVSEDDLIDETSIGKTIRIPITFVSASRRENSLVFEPFLESSSQRALDRYFYGRDIYTDEEGVMHASPYGTLQVFDGIPCVVANIENRTKTVKGSLNPQSGNYGIASFDNNGRLPFFVFLDRIISDMESQALSDTRVSSAYINRKKIEIEQDMITVLMLVTLNGGQVYDVPLIVNPLKVLP